MISGFEQMMNEKEERAEKRGKEQGTQRGIQVLVESCQELGHTKGEAMQMIVRKYALLQEEAERLAEKYWKD